MIHLAEHTDDAKGVLVVVVPSSAFAPHVLPKNDYLGVPYRDGTDTRWMSEQQLEQAYAERFDRRSEDRAELERLAAETTDHLDLNVGAWLVGVARPRVGRPSVLPDIPQADIRRIVIAAIHQGLEIAPREPGRGKGSRR
jgi:hypothetical protein